MMRKFYILLLLLVLPILCYGQFLALGGQYADKSDGQFFASMSFPTYHKENKLNIYLSNGLEYTTGGGAKISGLNMKALQISTYFSEDLYNDKPMTFLLSVDGGYNFDFRQGYKNGMVITPNLYLDYKIFFVKAGYDFDVTNGNSQFFFRAGVGIGLGTFKMLAKTKIR